MARNALPGARRELHKILRRDLPYPTEKPGVCPYNKDTPPAFLFCGQRTDSQAFLKTVSGASILGGKTSIGAHSVVGGNAFLTGSVADNTRVVITAPETVFKNA